MISTRLHGAIDYGVAALLGGLAATAPLSPRTRRILGAASGFHLGYSAVTDYEAGVVARIGMRQHLLLDAVGGASLCGLGVLLGDEPIADRLLLLGAGVAELAVVALSDDHPRSGPGQGSGPLERMTQTAAADLATAGYPPFDVPKPVADGVWVVDGEPIRAAGMKLPVRMTVFRLASGDLLLHSPTRFSLDLKRRLAGEGRIRFFVAPNVAHWTFLSDWQRACPDAETWAAPNLRERRAPRRAGVRLDADLGTGAGSPWADEFEELVVPGALGFQEIALFHRPSRTLALADLILNLEPGKLPPLARSLARLLGITAPDGKAPAYLRRIVESRQPEAGRVATRLVALQPERVIFSHGRWFDRNATAELRRSLSWLLPRTAQPCPGNP